MRMLVEEEDINLGDSGSETTKVDDENLWLVHSRISSRFARGQLVLVGDNVDHADVLFDGGDLGGNQFEDDEDSSTLVEGSL